MTSLDPLWIFTDHSILGFIRRGSFPNILFEILGATYEENVHGNYTFVCTKDL